MDLLQSLQQSLESLVQAAQRRGASFYVNDAALVAKRIPTLALHEAGTQALAIVALWHARATNRVSVLHAAAVASALKQWLSHRRELELSADTQATVMVSPTLALHRVGVHALMLYCSAVAVAQLRCATLLTKASHAGLLALIMSWVYHKNATRFVWMTWNDTAKEVANRAGGVPALWLIKDATAAIAFTLLTDYVLKGELGSMRRGLESHLRWLADYQQAVLYAVASGMDKVAATIFPWPNVLKSVAVGALTWPTSFVFERVFQILSFENPNHPLDRSWKAMTSLLVLFVAEGLDVASKRSREEWEFFTNYTTVARQRRATNTFLIASIGYIILQVGMSLTQKPEEQTAVSLSVKEKPRFNSAEDFVMLAAEKSEADARVKEIKDELEFVGRFMEKNHADIMRMIETTNEALSWEERAVQKLSYLKDQGIVDDVVSEVAIANREKVARLREAVEGKIYRARKVQQELARKRGFLQDKSSALETGATAVASEKNEIRGIAQTEPRKEMGGMLAAGVIACLAFAGSLHRDI